MDGESEQNMRRLLRWAIEGIITDYSGKLNKSEEIKFSTILLTIKSFL
ncbi:hypothetical protein [Winogradskyella sp. UBA3174]|nr:hypothetical protein [Winogradskyella sp. UBA3174]|tara:strand:- start:18462 stop:18605 length:144 start_codon:yes stop_codon:yes gene_type:complete